MWYPCFRVVGMQTLTSLSGVVLVGRDGGVSIAGLAEELRRQSANLSAAEADWLVMLAVFDEFEGWSESGALS